MFDLFCLWLGAVLRIFRNRQNLLLENLVLRQQLVVLKRRHPKPKLGLLDKLFWVAARQFWSQWRQSLFLVMPETVVRWHRAGFRRYWTVLCQARKAVGGGKRISKEIRDLIFQMVAENPLWGAPRIHGELLMLGFDVSERTISRWMSRAPRKPEPAKRWLSFLHNHREAIAAMDFFTVPTVTFNLLYCCRKVRPAHFQPVCRTGQYKSDGKLWSSDVRRRGGSKLLNVYDCGRITSNPGIIPR
jgi:putative transposase